MTAILGRGFATIDGAQVDPQPAPKRATPKPEPKRAPAQPALAPAKPKPARPVLAGVKHGGAGSSYSLGCRCRPCTDANAARGRRRSLERFAEPKDPNDPRHGIPNFYTNHGCRCEKCVAAHGAQCKRYREKRKAARLDAVAQDRRHRGESSDRARGARGSGRR